MGIFLSSSLLLAALAQGSASARQGDSVGTAARAEDGRASLALGRHSLARFDAYHAHGTEADTSVARQILDSADVALSRAAAALGSPGLSPAGDSARVLRVRAWSGRALVAWERGGLRTGAESWGPPPSDLRLSPVLEELGENLLRACPSGGVLLTANDADTYASWYMRFVRGLRPDLLVVPFRVWQEDSVFRARAALDLQLGKTGTSAWLPALAERRPVCASMGFEKPPESRGRVKWQALPLVWVTGRRATEQGVPPRDFVFAAAQMGVEDRDPWAQSALALYVRAARATPALCKALAAFHAAQVKGHCPR